MSSDDLEPGVFSEVETHSLRGLLDVLGDDRRASLTPLRNAEAADRLSRHLASLAASVVAALPEEVRAELGGALLAQLIERLDDLSPSADVLDRQVLLPPRMLDAVESRQPDGTFATTALPLTPLLDTAVLTNRQANLVSNTN